MAIVLGTGGDDLLSGTGSNDLLRGFAGDDTLRGLAGDDTLAGGAGADFLQGGSGFDIADYRGSSAGVVVILSTNVANQGDAAGDTLLSIEGVRGSQFNDRLGGTSGKNELFGRQGNDRLLGDRGADLLHGGAGTDTADYRKSGVGVVVNLATGVGSKGYAAGDTLVSIERVFGSSFNDRLTGFSGEETLRGQGGDDQLIGSAGADVLNGGGGIDTADYRQSATGVNVDLALGLGTAGDADGDTLISIERVFGSTLDDTISGSVDNDTLRGFAGNDALDGGDGDDVLEGGAGADALTGGTGIDMANYASASAGVVADLSSPGANAGEALGDSYNGIENLGGSEFRDILGGDAAGNTIFGRAGNDYLLGRGGNDTLFGGDGNDKVVGGIGNDSADGGAGDDHLEGNEGNDQLFGDQNIVSTADGAGDDALYGGAGNDTLFGNAGSDLLFGGTGDDILLGGDGADIVVASNGVDFLLGGTSSLDGGLNSGPVSDGDADRFVFGTDVDVNGVTTYAGFQIAVVVDFSAEDQDRLVFHTSLEGRISATFANGNQDILLNVDQDGNGATDAQVLIQDLVATLGLDTSLSPQALLDFLTHPDTGVIDFMIL